MARGLPVRHNDGHSADVSLLRQACPHRWHGVTGKIHPVRIILNEQGAMLKEDIGCFLSLPDRIGYPGRILRVRNPIEQPDRI